MQLLHFSKALADPTRLRLLNVLARHELSVNEMVAALRLGQSGASRHLRILAEAGLVDARRDGQWVFYRAAAQGPGRDFVACLRPFLDADADVDPALAADLRAAREVMAGRSAESASFFNAIAPDWDRLRHELLGGFDPAPELLARMPACAAAADLGCGAGDLLKALLAKARAVVGVDNSPRMLELARRRLPDAERVSLRLGDLMHLPLREAEVQAAVLCLSLHHAPDPAQALAEAGRILAPGGALLILDFTRHGREDLREQYGDRWLGFDPEELRAWLDAAGLGDIASTRITLLSGLTLILMTARKS
jgi:ArsR family transcriptional regulator